MGPVSAFSFQLYLFLRLAIMAAFLQNPLPWRVLTFRRGLYHTKNGPELILEGRKRVVCLHYETQQTNKNTQL
jgi:hypothetical protein